MWMCLELCPVGWCAVLDNGYGCVIARAGVYVFYAFLGSVYIHTVDCYSETLCRRDSFGDILRDCLG